MLRVSECTSPSLSIAARTTDSSDGESGIRPRSAMESRARLNPGPRAAASSSKLTPNDFLRFLNVTAISPPSPLYQVPYDVIAQGLPALPDGLAEHSDTAAAFPNPLRDWTMVDSAAGCRHQLSFVQLKMTVLRAVRKSVIFK